jgi:hypothetical protein
MRKKIYEFIAGLLTSIDEQPVKHVDIWNNQIAFLGEETPFATPAVFIEFMPIQWEVVCAGGYAEVYGADVGVKLHVVTDSRVGKWSEVISVFELIDAIGAALSNADRISDSIGALVRAESVTDNLFGELMHNVETYRCHVISEVE